LRDLVGGTPTAPVTFQLAGHDPQLSSDGNTLVIATDRGGVPDAVAVDLATSISRDEAIIRPVALDSTLNDIGADAVSASVEGSTVAFLSQAPLLPGDSTSLGDFQVHVRDLTTGLMKRVGNASYSPALAGDGATSVYWEGTDGTGIFRSGPADGG